MQGKPQRQRRRAGFRFIDTRRYMPRLPPLIMGNVGSLAEGMDEFMAFAWSQTEYLECSLICFTKTWFPHLLINIGYAK